MLLSANNKFIFSIFSESKDYLILTVYVQKFGKTIISFLQTHLTRTDASGKFLPSFVFNTRLKVDNCSDLVINFSRGRIIFNADAVKVEFSFDTLMLYLNYTWEKQTKNPLNVLGKMITENNPIAWNSFDFKGFVKGNLVTPNASAEFNNATGNIDLIKSKEIRLKADGLLWSRLHHKEIDLACSGIINKAGKSDYQLHVLYNNKLILFSDINYEVKQETLSPKSSVRYPDNILLTSKNEEYQISVFVHGTSEVIVNEMVNSVDFIGRLFAWLYRRMSGNPREIILMAKADVILKNGAKVTEFNGITVISEYTGFAK